MNPKIFVLIGVSGSGKSTWAANYIQNTENTLRVNRDDIRRQLTGLKILNENYYDRKDIALLEKRVTDIVHENTRYLLSKKYNVILDNTHLQMKYIRDIFDNYSHLADIEYLYFPNTDYEELSKRVSDRENHGVNTDYIERQIKQYVALEKELKLHCPTNVEKKRTYLKVGSVYNIDLPDAIICDLDGTLCLYGDKNPYERDFENDIINKSVCDILHSELCERDLKILFLSGRSGKFRNQTVQFLRRIFVDDNDYELHMRDENDSRKDYLVKEEMLQKILEKYNILYCIDDRLQVIENVWNKYGIFCFNVNQGNKRF